jgi:hypothetical protein
MVGGTYQVKPPFPFTPGLEAAGEVIETGDGVPSLRTGQRVLAVLRNGGGYAEEIVLDAATVLSIPETMDFVTAAAFPVAYGTSHFALTHRGDLQSGETLLVLGAAGGVGIQWPCEILQNGVASRGPARCRDNAICFPGRQLSDKYPSSSIGQLAEVTQGIGDVKRAPHAQSRGDTGGR